MQIETIIRTSKWSKLFRGCFPADKIPDLNTYPAALIVNEDPSTERGTHWVAIFITNPDHVFYFDSFGFPPNKYISHYLSKFKFLTLNHHTFQSMLSNACAHYCIFFLSLMSQSYSYKTILKILSNQQNSDVYVKYYVSKCIR